MSIVLTGILTSPAYANLILPVIDVTNPANSGDVFTAFPISLGGNVSDDIEVASVIVRVTDLGTGLVWDGVNQVWVTGSTTWNPATSFDQSSWSYNFNPSGTTSGNFLVTAIATDWSHNVGVSPYPQKTFTVLNGDSSPPSIDVTSPANSGDIFTAFPISLGGNVSDDIEVASVIVRVTDLATGQVWDGTNQIWVTGSTTWNAATTFDQTSWNYDFNPPSTISGTFLVTAIAYDWVGKSGVSPSPQKTFTIPNGDSGPPSIDVTSPVNSGDVFTAFPVTLGGNVSDDTEVVSVLVRVIDLTTGLVWNGTNQTWVTGSTTWNPTTFDQSSWSYNFNPPNMNSGTFFVTAIAYDRLVNLGVTPSPQKSFQVSAGDSAPPSIDVTSPVNSGEMFASFPVTLAGNVNDDVLVASVFIRVTDLITGLVWDGTNQVWVAGSTTWNAATTFNQSSWNYDLNPPSMTSGTFLVTAIAYDWLGNAAVTPSPQKTFNIGSTISAMFDGNSTVFGTGAVPGISDYPIQLYNGLIPKADFSYFNRGFGGATVLEIASEAPMKVDQYIQTNNLLSVWIGVNNLFQGDTGISIYADLTTYIAARKLAGWTVAVLTIPPTNMPVSANTERITYNDLILTNNAGADIIIDVAASPELQDPFNSVYRTTDGVHYLEAGYTVIADLVRPHVQQLHP